MVKIIAEHEFQAGSDRERAWNIVKAMDGCQEQDIVNALEAWENTREIGRGQPARWLKLFDGTWPKRTAGLERPVLIRR